MKIKILVILIMVSLVTTASAIFYNKNKNENLNNNSIKESEKLVVKKKGEAKKKETIKDDVNVDDIKKVEKPEEKKKAEVRKDSQKASLDKAKNDGKIKQNNVKKEEIKKVEVKEVSEEKIEVINFNTYRKENHEMKKGNEKIVQKGEQGSKKIIYRYELVDGKKKLKDKNEQVIKKPVDQIVAVGTLVIAESTGYYDRNQAVQTLEIVNAYRKSHGKHALAWNSGLETGTNIRAKELKTNFSHTRPNGQSWKSVSSIAMAENVAYGYSSSQKVIDGFMNSEGHRNNILNDRWSSVSMSLYIEDGVYYWAQLFAE